MQQMVNGISCEDTILLEEPWYNEKKSDKKAKEYNQGKPDEYPECKSVARGREETYLQLLPPKREGFHSSYLQRMWMFSERKKKSE